MIIPDLNLLMYAHNEAAPAHAQTRSWWNGLLGGNRTVVIPWVVSIGFIRLTTHRAVLSEPLVAGDSIAIVESWFEHEVVQPLECGPRHLSLLAELLEAAGAAGSLTTDAHIAALAREHSCEIHTNDADFRRFPGIRTFNPLA